MTEAIESLAPQGLVSEVTTAGTDRSVAEGIREPRLPGATMRHALGRWSSSLSGADLECLLGVIESQLIPQLLNAYSPASSSPLVPTAASQ